MELFPQLRQKAERLLWGGDLADLPYVKRSLLLGARIVYSVARDVAEGQLSLRAMSLVYTTIISLVPLLALCFSVLKGFGAHNRIQPALLNALEPLGEKRFEIAEKIVQFVDNIQVGVLGALGLALLIYSVVSMMQKIEGAFNYVWHIHRNRPFAQRFGDYLSVLLVAPLLIFLSVGITASLRTNVLESSLAGLPVFKELLYTAGYILPYFLMALGFAFAYFFMPNTRVRVYSAFIGGLITAIVWKTMGWGFTQFVVHSSSHAAIYSAFASIIIFMVWLYVGWLVLLIGASIAFYHQHPYSLQLSGKNLAVSHRVREKLALLVLHAVSKHYTDDKGGLTVTDIARALHIPEYIADDIVNDLVSAECLTSSGSKQLRYLPARPPEHIRLPDVVQAMRALGESASLPYGKLKKHETIDRYLEEAPAKKMAEATLKDCL